MEGEGWRLRKLIFQGKDFVESFDTGRCESGPALSRRLGRLSLLLQAYFEKARVREKQQRREKFQQLLVTCEQERHVPEQYFTG